MAEIGGGDSYHRTYMSVSSMMLCELLTANRIYISLLHMGDENRPQVE